MTSHETTGLPSGAAMPLLGFGTWQLTGDAAATATGWALETGYRHVDTATMYGNEREVGRAVAASGLPRGELFLTTKLPPDHAGSERATLERSLELLDCGPVDLWLVHWPPPDAMASVWQAFVTAQADGLVRDIGVSNYSLEQIDEITDAVGVAPAVNQIRWSPLLFDRQVLEGHRERGVVLEGYSALRGGTLEHPAITAIAAESGRTPAQVIIRWHLQHGVVVIPKSGDRERIAANAEVAGFELDARQMLTLDGLAAG